MADDQHKAEAQIFSALPQSSACKDHLLAAEMREKCLRGFMRPARQRIAFTLRVILDLPVKVTAAVMDTSENNVKALTHRARNFMKELMENLCSFINPANPCQCKIWVAFALTKKSVSRTASGYSIKQRPPGKITMNLSAKSKNWWFKRIYRYYPKMECFGVF